MACIGDLLLDSEARKVLPSSDEGVLVRVGLYLRPVYVLDLQADELALHEHLHDLGEQIVPHRREPVLAEEVDGVEVRRLHAAQPHEVHITTEELLHLPTGIDVLEIGVKNDLDQHPGMVAAGAATLIAVLDLPDVEVVDHRIQNAYGIVLGDKVAQTWRKKQIVVLIVRFKDYLCHCLITDKLFFFYFATTR